MHLTIVSVLAAVLFILLDLVWFYFVSGFFKDEIGSIARLTPEGKWDVRLAPAIMAYVLMGVGVAAFVYLNAASLLSAVLLGALFGLVGYGLYDLTNLATLSDWTVRFTIVDIMWGTFLCATVSGAVYLIAKHLF
jgi:uncharacterized membrane protein